MGRHGGRGERAIIRRVIRIGRGECGCSLSVLVVIIGMVADWDRAVSSELS